MAEERPGGDYLGGIGLHPEFHKMQVDRTMQQHHGKISEAASEAGHAAIQEELKKIYGEGITDSHVIVRRTMQARDAAITETLNKAAESE